MVAHVTAEHLGADLEPTLGLPSQSSDGAGVERSIGVRVGFVINLFAYKDRKLRGVLCHQTREHHVGQVVVAHCVGVEIVGDAAAVVGMAGGLSRDTLSHVGVVVTEQTYGYGSDIPSVVCVVEPSLQLGCGGRRNLVQAVDFSDDALLGAEFLQLLCVWFPCIIVRDDDEVLGTIAVVSDPVLHTSLIVDHWQLVIVHQLSGENGIPVGGTQTIIANVAVATAILDREFDIGIHHQLLGDRVVLERSDGYVDGVHTTDIRLVHGEGIFRIEGVFSVDLHVLLIIHLRFLVFSLEAKGGSDIHVLECLLLSANHVDLSLGTLWDGDQAAFHREVRKTSIVGDADGVDADF